MSTASLFDGTGEYPTAAEVYRRHRPRETCHLVSQPGDRRTRCGLRSDAVPVGWIRSTGDHELGHAFAGVDLPDWCNACILDLMKSP